MEDRLRRFVGTFAESLVDIEVALFYEANPSTCDTPAGVALRMYREMEQVDAALRRLARAGVLAERVLGAGRYHLYELTGDVAVVALLVELSQAYHDDAEARREIIRSLVGRAHGMPPSAETAPQRPGRSARLG